ncbi:reverse transcriptase [Gossypium australe]|uniref:Reverse transcriptase n=1 Tax=Gossypium australe TaxID=47621 RepID=A0A5B6WTD3_9ROSI|nr:reverse transcriptase [Gossypium australe]
MRLALKEGLLKGAKASRKRPAIAHLLFADDCILFGEASKKEASLLKGILKEYEICSGQCVNFNKSTSNTLEGNREEVLAILGGRPSIDMEKYLGLPSVVGRRKKESFQVLKEKVLFRIKRWSNRFLSQGGKEVFIKSILQAIPTYAMSCFFLPNSFCGELEKIMAKYWWQKAHGKKGIHWCRWQNLCLSKDEGGMGFRNMAKFNVSLLAKQGWRILNNPNSLVARVLKAKYFSNENFLNSCLENNCSFTWKSLWAAKGVLIDGLCWKVVAELINDSSRKWKEELIGSTFSEDIAEKILRIPLAKEPHDHMLAWSGEPSGEFTATSSQCRLFCCALWAIWGERNRCIHDRANRSGEETTDFIKNYILELNGTEEETTKVQSEVSRWKPPSGQFVKINFDAAYDDSFCQAAVGVVARDRKGSVLLSYSVIQKRVASAFAAEVIACSIAV